MRLSYRIHRRDLWDRFRCLRPCRHTMLTLCTLYWFSCSSRPHRLHVSANHYTYTVDITDSSYCYCCLQRVVSLCLSHRKWLAVIQGLVYVTFSLHIPFVLSIEQKCVLCWANTVSQVISQRFKWEHGKVYTRSMHSKQLSKCGYKLSASACVVAVHA